MSKQQRRTVLVREAPRPIKPPGKRGRMSYTFIDLFAGIGGMHSAFAGPETKCVFTSEWDRFAQQTYAANFPNHPITGDITKVDPSSLPDHDILLAGFPCQPFSIAGVSKKISLGRAHGFEDPTQGNLFFNIAAIIKAKQPRAFLLENVKNLKSHDGGNTFRVIMNTLRNELGYHVPEPRILDGRAFVPQHRERIFIVGYRDPHDFEFPALPKGKRTLASVLDPGPVDPRYTLSKKLWDYLRAYAAKHRAKGNGFGFGLVERTDIARTLSARYYKDGSEILVAQGRGNPRRLTPRECARLMGFPPDFKIEVSDTRAYKQFGNSVVVPLVKHVGDAMIEALKRQDRGEVAEPQQLQLSTANGSRA
ncbi:MAG: DNA (cytosine-5-)-methyltransferase [Candidatus Eisenbacteria bacterium]